MPRLARRSTAKTNLIRRIRTWLKRHAYLSNFGFELHPTDIIDSYGVGRAICAEGVVISAGGGCIIDM
jgi:hypothetical protein